MTQSEFIKYWIKRSGKKGEERYSEMAALPCNCGEPRCKGWAMVFNDFIGEHLDDWLRKASDVSIRVYKALVKDGHHGPHVLGTALWEEFDAVMRVPTSNQTNERG